MCKISPPNIYRLVIKYGTLWESISNATILQQKPHRLQFILNSFPLSTGTVTLVFPASLSLSLQD